MPHSFRFSCIAAVLALSVVAAPAVTGAQPMMNGAAPPAKTPHLIRVNRCDPQRQVTTVPAYPGFAPGFYPGNPYYWNDVYGYRYYQPQIVNSSGTLYLDYVNDTQKVMDTIEFGLIANGRLVAEVRDVGTFSPGAEIKHQFGLSPNVFPLQTGLPQCVPLRITYKDGTKWKNPHLPALRHDIYGQNG